MVSFFTVYWLFFQFGLLCFGGGYVLVPLIVNSIVNNPDYHLSSEMFGVLLAISQMTPGPIGLNTATFVGYIVGATTANNILMGVLGGIIGSIGLLTPGFFLISTVGYYLKRWEETLIVKGILTGIRPAATGLVLMAVVIFLGYSVFDGKLPLDLINDDIKKWPEFRLSALLIMLGAFGLTYFKKLGLIRIMLIAAGIGAAIAHF